MPVETRLDVMHPFRCLSVNHTPKSTYVLSFEGGAETRMRCDVSQRPHELPMTLTIVVSSWMPPISSSTDRGPAPSVFRHAARRCEIRMMNNHIQNERRSLRLGRKWFVHLTGSMKDTAGTSTAMAACVIGGETTRGLPDGYLQQPDSADVTKLRRLS